ncbi:MAG: hypothetical protein MHMPM18_000857 [Marteilia pararefringens]
MKSSKTSDNSDEKHFIEKPANCGTNCLPNAQDSERGKPEIGAHSSSPIECRSKDNGEEDDTRILKISCVLHMSTLLSSIASELLSHQSS